MKTQDSTRTYAYHFAKLTDKNNRTHSFNQDTPDFTSNFNKISFRYFAQCQQNQKRVSSPQTDLSKYPTVPQKVNQPVKKYTFSVLAKQQKQFRKSEDTQYVRSAALTPKYPLNMNKTFRNNESMGSAVENGEQLVFQKHAKQEIKKDHSTQNDFSYLKNANMKLEAEMGQLKTQNQLLRVRFEQAKKQKVQHQQEIKRLNSSIKEAQIKIDELKNTVNFLKNEKEMIQNEYRQARCILQTRDLLKSKIELSSRTIQHHLVTLGDYQKRAKEQETQLSHSKTQQKYRQILNLLGVDMMVEDKHEKVLKQIKKLSCLAEQNASFKAMNAQLQKQSRKLLHHLKKNEAELAKICNLNAFLSSQLAKTSILIENCNEEINLLNMKEVERNLILKFSLND